MISRYAISIGMIVAGSLCYHVCNRAIDARVAASVSLTITYSVALAIVGSVAIAEQWSGGSQASQFRYVNWPIGGLAVGIVLIEAGYLLAYRSGGRLSTASIFATTISSLLLLPAGMYLYGEEVSFMKVLGIGMAILGIGFISQG